MVISPANSRAEQAIERLKAASQAGDANAAMMLGGLHLRGREVPRDLSIARLYFERAAALGSRQAQRIAIGWRAGGTAGKADWAGALRLLSDMAASDLDARRETELIAAMDLDKDGQPHLSFDPQTICGDPEIRLFPGFATASECDYLIDAARPALAAAAVGSPTLAVARRSGVRTCQSMGFPLLRESPFIHAINRRIAKASGTGAAQGEPTQIFRYAVDEEFKPHLDSSPDFFENQRILTMLIYLNEDYGGGETRFLRDGLNVKGRKGDALLFSNVDDAGAPNPASRHAGLAVTSGEKWLLSRWIRQAPLDY